MLHKKKKGYAKGELLVYWYINTYKATGSDWLIKSLEQLNLSSDFTLLNLSANAGFYERDAYNYFDEHNFHPTFIIDDVQTGFVDETAHADENFIYLNRHYDLITSDLSNCGLCGDVILDSKGALWYAAGSKIDRKRKTLQVLHNYSCLMKKEDSMLLIDYDTFSSFFFVFFLDLYCVLSGMKKRQKDKPITLPCELSTYQVLERGFGKNIRQYFQFLEIAEESERFPLQKYRNIMYITKKNLSSLIEFLS